MEKDTFQLTQERVETIRHIIKKHQGNRGELISILEDIQEEFGYLPHAALNMLVEMTSHSLVNIYGVATFYKFFKLIPQGKHQITVCLGTACHVRGAPKVVEEFERQLGIKSGETTRDNEFSLQSVACLGACALGPIVILDGEYYSKVKPQNVRKILDKYKVKSPV